MYFKDDVVSKFRDNLQLLVRVETRKKSDDGKIPCEGLMIQLLRVLDCVVVLDRCHSPILPLHVLHTHELFFRGITPTRNRLGFSLKDTKACLNNDFSTYKRAFQHCRADIPNAEQITQVAICLSPDTRKLTTWAVCLTQLLPRSIGTFQRACQLSWTAQSI